MVEIYANATLNLAATNSPDSAEGCFTNCELIHRSRGWTFQNIQGETFAIRSRAYINHFPFRLEEYPLLKRGWAFQERLLSPRVLNFLAEERVIECAMKHRWEEKEQPRTWKEMPIQKADKVWREIIELHTRTSITFESDIFPALQGLATMMPVAMGW
jgi:hypothetical protein